MKLIIAGSRNSPNVNIGQILEKHGLYHLTSDIISGGSGVIDRLGEVFANEHSRNLVIFYANWNQHGRGAGPMRNQRMALYADALLAIWDGKSKGTLNMIEEMRKLGKPVYVEMVGG